MRSFALDRARNESYPGVFSEIKELAGEEIAMLLVGQYGGTRLYIPDTLSPEHALILLLGSEGAQQLADEFGGLYVEVPRAIKQLIAKRNSLIAADHAVGLSQSQLARKYQLTERTIRTILAQLLEATKYDELPT